MGSNVCVLRPIHRVYNVNKRVEVGSLMEQTGAITALEFFGTSHMLSGSADNSICIWRTSDWNCLHILGGHKYVQRLVFMRIALRY